MGQFASGNEGRITTREVWHLKSGLRAIRPKSAGRSRPASSQDDLADLSKNQARHRARGDRRCHSRISTSESQHRLAAVDLRKGADLLLAASSRGNSPGAHRPASAETWNLPAEPLAELLEPAAGSVRNSERSRRARKSSDHGVLEAVTVDAGTASAARKHSSAKWENGPGPVPERSGNRTPSIPPSPMRSETGAVRRWSRAERPGDKTPDARHERARARYRR